MVGSGPALPDFPLGARSQRGQARNAAHEHLMHAPGRWAATKMKSIEMGRRAAMLFGKGKKPRVASKLDPSRLYWALPWKVEFLQEDIG